MLLLPWTTNGNLLNLDVLVRFWIGDGSLLSLDVSFLP